MGNDDISEAWPWNGIESAAPDLATPATWDRQYRVLVADGSAMFRRGLVGLLSAHDQLEVVGEAADAGELLGAARRFQPEVVVVDAQIPGGSEGVAGELSRHVVGVSILTLSSSPYALNATRPLSPGTTGLVLKDAEPELLVAAIMAAAHGYAVWPRSIMQDIGSTWWDPSHEPFDGLSHREFEVLCLLTGGMTTKVLASHLAISEKTVRNHIASMYAKLGLNGRPQLVRYAIRKGLSGPPEGA